LGRGKVTQISKNIVTVLSAKRALDKLTMNEKNFAQLFAFIAAEGNNASQRTTVEQIGPGFRRGIPADPIEPPWPSPSKPMTREEAVAKYGPVLWDPFTPAPDPCDLYSDVSEEDDGDDGDDEDDEELDAVGGPSRPVEWIERRDPSTGAVTVNGRAAPVPCDVYSDVSEEDAEVSAEREQRHDQPKEEALPANPTRPSRPA
jgi:hypothetical protein